MRCATAFFVFVSSAEFCLPQMGSPGGGETQAIALHPFDPSIIYVGAAKGLCKTTSGGQDNWPAVGLETYSPRAVVLDPRHPDTVYAGTYKIALPAF